jgi:cytochrome b involved in lipid metabolism
MRTTATLLLLAIAIIGSGYWLYGMPSPLVVSTSSGEISTSTLAASAGYTLAQVAKHNSATSCWTAINGNVYDLTDWISQHPGGESAILTICGKDGSSAFDGQHGNDPRAQNELANFKIGPLAP